MICFARMAATACFLLATLPSFGRMNLVFILTDDQRHDLLGCAGHPYLETPGIDRLAREGALLKNAFVTTSLCSPSRASMLTGQYAHRHGIVDNSTPLRGLWLFPKALKEAGYATGFIGKWHMGASDEPQPGFDRWVSLIGQGQYFDPMFVVDGRREQRKGYVADLITEEAVRFIEGAKDKPFFVFISHKAVHADFDPAPKDRDRYKDRVLPTPDSMADIDANYAGKPAWVRAQRASWHGVDGMYDRTTNLDEMRRRQAETMLSVDAGVGAVMESLRRSGHLDDTLVIYTSDNGFQWGEHGLIDKRTMYEASIRVPMIVWAPKLIAAGLRPAQMALNIDIAPTFLEAAGVPIPGHVQGRSMLGFLSGEAGEWRDDFLYEYFWERSFPQTPSVMGVRTDRYKFMKYHGVWDRYELYDLESDPGEMKNLLGGYMIGSEGGTLDGLIRRKAPPDLKKLYIDMEQRLARLQKESEAAAEPNWRP